MTSAGKLFATSSNILDKAEQGTSVSGYRADASILMRSSDARAPRYRVPTMQRRDSSVGHQMITRRKEESRAHHGSKLHLCVAATSVCSIWIMQRSSDHDSNKLSKTTAQPARYGRYGNTHLRPPARRLGSARREKNPPPLRLL